MKTFAIHPAALAFPPLRGSEMEALKKSILTHGQEFPAVTHEGKILDGRNRMEAIRQLVAEKKLPASTQLKVVPFRGGSVPGFVDSANDKRRHLNESQRAMVAAKLLPMFRKEAKERQAAAVKAANNRRKKSPGQKALSLSAPGRAKSAAAEAAKAAGGKVSARSVERAAFVQKADPVLARKVFEGELSVKQAERQIRREAQLEQVKAYVPPEGTYEVIVADFPWQYDDGLEGMDRDLPYPTMDIAEICAFKIPAAPDCALFLWVTNSHLIDPDAFPRLARSLWHGQAFETKAIRTWEKDKMGLGRYWRNCTEHLVLLTRGHPVFNDVTQLSHFEAPRGANSEKPERAYRDIEAMCASQTRLELFARKPRAGWVTSGSEIDVAPVTDDSAGSDPDASQHQAAPSAGRFPSASGSDFPSPESVSAAPFEEIPF